MKITDIQIEKRYRSDLGSLDSLCRSIEEIGLLHPVVVTPDARLIAGQRRLEAYKQLGWQDIPVTIIELEDILKGEHDENACRKDFLPSEMVAIAKALEPVAKEQAKERHGTRTDLQLSGKFPESKAGQTRDKIAAGLGVSGRTMEKAIKVVEAAEAEPEIYRSVLNKMDESGSVDRAYKEIRQKEREQQRRLMASESKSLPDSDKYNIFHADMREWKAPRQYDFIITDPPYPKEYISLYADLSRKALEWLKPGGLLIAMCGQSYLDQIYNLLNKDLDYYWTVAYLTPGQPTPLRQVNVNTTWKPLLIFRKGKYEGKIFGDVFRSEANDKDHHKWGQSTSGMIDIVFKMCLPGQYILDPFCGAGTTGIAAIKHGCLFDGLDIDMENVNISKGRINDATKER